MQIPRARPVLALAVAIGAVILVGCGADEDPVVQQPTTEADQGGDAAENGEAAEPNQADVEFTQNMIAHHEQAVEMAALAEERADSAEVQRLAEQIEAAQQPEIEMMKEWLESWGEEPLGEEDMDHGDMDGQDSSGMGMMSSDDMAELGAATGAEFDRLFLEMMIEHHRGAIEMAMEVEDAGSLPEVLELAATVIETQEAEVDEMERLLRET